MYNQSYDEYMRNILGYPMERNTYESNMQPNYNCNYCENTMNNMNNNFDLEQCYPEIYKIIYPMVKKACSRQMGRITNETIDNLTNEIYSAIDDSGEIGININIQNRSSSSSQQTSSEKEKISSKEKETRQIGNRNPYLNDLIRILLLRELIGRPNFYPPFPVRPFPGPFPGGPRPPMRPRDYEEDYLAY